MTALIAGSTGLIGSQLLTRLLASPRYSHVIALSRRALSVNHSKLKVIITDFQGLESHSKDLVADDVFCCLGTTKAKAGSKEAFYEVDFFYPVKLAHLTHRNEARQFLIVTALGADKRSKIFYNRVKGEVEEAIESVGFESLHIFRPSLLLGDRQEKRFGEQSAIKLFKVFGFAVPEKYEPIKALDVANAMLYFASLDNEGVVIHHSHEMQKKF